jgi:hypothetical protein
MIHNIRFSTYDRFVILQVQEASEIATTYELRSVPWRDAKVEDLLSVSEHLNNRYRAMLHVSET